MRPAIACLLLLGLGFACCALAAPRAPERPAAIAIDRSPIAPPSTSTVLADAPKTSPPG